MRKSPYILSTSTTTKIMGDVLLALVPAFVASVVIFGYRSALLTLVCVVSCVVSEWLYCLALRLRQSITDLSAVVTGVLLAFSLPVGFPLWMAAVGSVFSVAVVKMLFGGIGENFANPAVTGRIFLFLSFGKEITNWANTSRLINSSATPLAEGESDIFKLLLGFRAGCIGETCIIAIIIGGVYLVARKVITFTAPISTLAGAAAVSLICGRNPVFDLLTGSLMLAAFFMVTDYSTSPVSKKGKVIFGLGVGAITVLIREFGTYPEGVSFAILLMNILSPLIDKMTFRMPFGGVKNV